MLNEYARWAVKIHMQIRLQLQDESLQNPRSKVCNNLQVNIMRSQFSWTASGHDNPA